MSSISFREAGRHRVDMTGYDFSTDSSFDKPAIDAPLRLLKFDVNKDKEISLKSILDSCHLTQRTYYTSM